MVERQVRQLPNGHVQEPVDQHSLFWVILEQPFPLSLISHCVRKDEERCVVAGKLSEIPSVRHSHEVHEETLVRPGGFEPPTRGLEVRRSVH